MVSVITSFSRITLIAFIVTFTFFDLFLMFERKFKEETVSVLVVIQSVLLVLFWLNSSIVLFLNLERFSIIVIGIIMLAFMSFIAFSINTLVRPASKALVNNILMLLSISLITLQRLSEERAIRQFVFIFIAFIVGTLFIVALQKIKGVHKGTWFYLGFDIIALIVVFFMGSVEYGAKLSLNFGGISIQPSEFVKITFLFFMASCIVKYRDFRGFLYTSVGAAIHVLILVICKDLGTAFIFLMTYLFLIFIAYKNYIVVALELLVITIGGILVYQLFPHIQTRFLAWSDPLSVIDDQGYQICQSLFAIGTGGWLGSGLCNGMPTKIPVVTKDFIFAAISEEMGAIIGLSLVLIYITSFFMIFNVAYDCADSMYMLVVNGIAIIFAVQTLLNIGGVIKFIPSTGVTLPFVSYGGSSLLSMFLCFYLVEASRDLSYK